jgi:choline dehydrogenase-like flavoprotein
MYVDGTSIKSHQDIQCDVAIIGTGAGGAVVGKELAEKGYNVVFIEEGAYHPPDSHRDLPSQAVARLYRNAGMTVALGTPFFPVPYGCAVGGTTLINSGTCFRTPSDLHEKWTTEFALPMLTEEALAPHFARVEKTINVQPSDWKVMARSNTFCDEVLSAEGIPGKPLLRNVVNCKGCGLCCYGCTSGAKQSMDVSYIPKAMQAGAWVYTRALAKKLVRKGNRITGIEGRFLDKRGYPTRNTFSVHSKITIVAAGTVNTPGILKTAIRSRHLGEHLTVHPAGKIYMELPEDVMGWNGTPQAYSLDILHKEGILFEGIFLPPDVAATMNPYVGKQVHEFMRNYKHMATFGFMIEDSSRGRVLNIPFAGPLIRFNMNQQDADKFKRATSFLARIFLKHGVKRIIPMIHSNVKEIHNEADLKLFEDSHIQPEDIEAAAFHPLGTARMARDAEHGVVDSNCKVFDRERLYVCDGSVMPSALGVNPQLTIMAFADRLAAHLHETAASWGGMACVEIDPPKSGTESAAAPGTARV